MSPPRTPVPDVVVAAGSPCEECRAPIGERYYLVNGHGVCAACEQRLQGSFRNALALGLLAAIGCIALYYAVFALLQMRFVFVAVVAGVAIGAAVRKAAHAGTLLRYRWLAVVLTYLATAATYAHSVLEMPDVGDPVQAFLRALYLPVLMVMHQKNLVTLVLLGFGLHEAWKFSAPPRARIEGPFSTPS